MTTSSRSPIAPARRPQATTTANAASTTPSDPVAAYYAQRRTLQSDIAEAVNDLQLAEVALHEDSSKGNVDRVRAARRLLRMAQNALITWDEENPFPGWGDDEE